MLVRRLASSVVFAACLVLLPALPPASAGGGGTLLWASLYGPRQGGAVAVATSPDGSRAFVTGTLVAGGDRRDFGTVAYDASTGDMLWARTYDGPAGSGDQAFDLAVSPDGTKVFVTGWTRAGGSFDYATVAYDAADGSDLWDAIYDGPAGGWDMPTSVAADPNGSLVFVTGRSDAATTADYATVAYDASTGSQVWVARHRRGQGTAVTTSPDGSRVFVTGLSSGSAGGYDYATVAYDASTGSQTWAKRFDAGPEDDAMSLAASPDGSRVFVTGRSARGGDFDYATVAYDAATGTRLWAGLYNGPGGGDDQAAAVAASPDGSAVFVTGHSNGGPSTLDDYATLAYDAATGARLWLRRLERPGSDWATALAVSPAGSEVFVTGYSDGPNGSDYATLAYDASSGAGVWSRHYDGPGHGLDQARSVAAAPDGSRVFVTGSAFGLSRYVYATVAYAA